MFGQDLVRIIFIISCFMSIVRTTREKNKIRKEDYPDNTYWKKEFEDELTDAMLTNMKRENFTSITQSTTKYSDNEAVVEKIMDSLTASEKYLKKVEGIDIRLNRLDTEVREKTNDILRFLSEITKAVRTQYHSDKLDVLSAQLKSDVAQLRSMLNSCNRESRDFTTDGNLSTRLSHIEGNLKNVLAGVESIVSVISEVKSREFSKQSGRVDVGNNFDTLNLLNQFRRNLYELRIRKCDCKGDSRVDVSGRYPTDCYEIQMQGFNVSGIYKIKPDDMDPFYVFCDLSTAGGGWTVFQNRFDGSQDFYRSWSDYKHGFGNLAGELWLGLEKLHFLTNQKLYELRVDVETQIEKKAYASYSAFTIGPEHEGFRISTLGTYHGTAGDSLSYHAGQKFSTYDVDKDEWNDGACAIEHGGAWWYKECDKSNLNGRYTTSSEDYQGQNIYWITFKGPNVLLTKTKMMIRPLPDSRPSDLYELSRKTLSGTTFNALRLPQKLIITKPESVDSSKGSYDLSPIHPVFDETQPRNNAYFSYEQ